MGSRRTLLLAVAVLVGVGAASARADDMPLSPTLQAAVFKKIFSYDRTLIEKGTFEVLVVHGEDAAVAASVVDAFGESGIRASTLPVSELAAIANPTAVVYVAPGAGAGIETVESVCTGNGILSVSGVPELALSGDVAIGIGTRDQKPEILIHLRRIKAEGHELQASLLSLARVIR